MPIDLNNPFAQALIQQGRSRGYNPMSIAASIGNASAENGLRTNGAPGDNGTAFGGFQWRLDRKDALMRKAQAMGKSWDDPTVQAAHWYDEQDGSESKWGLKNAKDLQSAVNSTVSALRPAGWTPRDPTGAHNYSGRLSAAEEAFRQLNGGQAPQMLPGQPAYDPRADMPAEDAQETSFTAPPKEGWEGFLDGGPGALFGKPQEGWNIGDAMSGAGIAMMARDNPSGAAALASYINGPKKRQGEDDKYQNIYDPKSGKLIRIPKAGGGQITTQQINDPAKPAVNQQMTKSGEIISTDDQGNIVNRQKAFEPEAKSISDASRKLFQKNDEAGETAYNAATETQKWTKKIMDGQVDLSAMGRMGNAYSSYMNDSDEKTRNAAQLYAHIEKLRNARLLEAKGVQTEGDAVRALDALLPGASKYDNKAVATLFRGLSSDFNKTYDQNRRYNEPLISKYKTDIDPDDYYKSRHDSRMKEFQSGEESINKGWETFNRPTVPSPEATPITGRDPIKNPEKPKGSFKDFSLGRK